MPGNVLETRAVVAETVIEAHDCPSCGVIYGITADYYRLRRIDGQGWLCPNGHSVIATNTTLKENRTLREKNLDLRARLDQAEADAEAKKRDIARMKKRAKAGLCQFCRRHFVNVARHVENRHPNGKASRSGRKATT